MKRVAVAVLLLALVGAGACVSSRPAGPTANEWWVGTWEADPARREAYPSTYLDEATHLRVRLFPDGRVNWKLGGIVLPQPGSWSVVNGQVQILVTDVTPPEIRTMRLQHDGVVLHLPLDRPGDVPMRCSHDDIPSPPALRRR